MIIAKDEELILYTGLAFSVPYDFTEDDNTPTDLAGKTASAIMINIHEDFKDDDVNENFGTITIEPDTQKGRLLLELTESETAKFKIPEDEDNKYTDSDIYAKIIVVDEANKPLLDINVRPIKAR